MKKTPKICGIVAVGPDNIIGCDGRLPWHSVHDMYYFKQTTMGYPCIFGKNTYENLPKKPLPGRLNVICSSSYQIKRDGDVLYVPSLEEAIKQCGNAERVFICGGAALYKYALEHDLIDTMYLTRIVILNDKLKKQITKNPKANTYFPYKFDWNKWILYSQSWYRNTGILPGKESPDLKAYFYEYKRVR